MTDIAGAGRPDPLRLRSADDLVAVVPYITGFHPSDSLVALGFGCPSGTFSARFDLPAPDSAESVRCLVEHIADLLVRHEVSMAALVGYGPGESVTPLIEVARVVLADRKIRLFDALRVQNGRYWSYLCKDLRCCPADGMPFDIATSRVAAAATVAGCVALPSRAEVERMVEPVTGAERAAMGRATADAERRFIEWFDTERGTGRAGERLADEGTAFVRTVIARARSGDTAPSDDDVAWLGVLLTNLRVRDAAWMSIGDDRLDPQISLWRTVVRRVAEPYVPAPACLLSVAAWLGGQGALANVALDRAQRADGDYSMAAVLREGMLSGLTPGALRGVMRPGGRAA